MCVFVQIHMHTHTHVSVNIYSQETRAQCNTWPRELLTSQHRWEPKSPLSLSSIRGAANPVEGDVVINGVLSLSERFYSTSFGAIALIAMTPILAIQVLGLASKFKTVMSYRVMRQQMADSRNDEIIHFN